MGADQNTDWVKAAASALEWWQDAGVDVLVEDAPHDWFAAPPPVIATPAPTRADAPAALPDTAEAFAAWRMGTEAPDARWHNAALAPTIVADAPLLVLVDCPEQGDVDRLMSGDAGRLLDNMLAAIGRSRADTSLASLCVRRPTTGASVRAVAPRLGEIARHQVALARPTHVLALGDAANRAMLGMNTAEARGRLQSLKHNEDTIAHVVASFHPGFLLTNPECKADAWRDLLLLRRELAAGEKGQGEQPS